MIIAFIGPSIALQDARQVVDAVFLGPARQGDILRAARHKPLGIALIDGYFHNVPAVWHKEILWAMDQGVHVLGGSSMGALRAAELAAFGMVGVGRIFEDFHAARLTRDDEVALIHSDAELGYRPLSVPLVNIRATLESAVAAGVVDQSLATAVLEQALGDHYSDRAWRPLLSADRYARQWRDALTRLRAWIPDHQVDQKRLDALATLQALAEVEAAGVPREATSFSFEHTALWQQLTREAGRLHLDPDQAGVMAPTTHIMHALAHTPQRHEELELRAAHHLLAVHEARRSGFALDEAELVAKVQEFRRERELWEPEDLSAWLDRNGLSRRGFLEMLTDRALVERMHSSLQPQLFGPICDLLRLEGSYEEVAQTAMQPDQTWNI